MQQNLKSQDQSLKTALHQGKPPVRAENRSGHRAEKMAQKRANEAHLLAVIKDIEIEMIQKESADMKKEHELL